MDCLASDDVIVHELRDVRFSPRAVAVRGCISAANANFRIAQTRPQRTLLSLATSLATRCFPRRFPRGAIVNSFVPFIKSRKNILALFTNKNPLCVSITLFLRALGRVALADGLADGLVGWLVRAEEHKVHRVYGRKPKFQVGPSLFLSAEKKIDGKNETRMHLYCAYVRNPFAVAASTQ